MAFIDTLLWVNWSLDLCAFLVQMLRGLFLCRFLKQSFGAKERSKQNVHWFFGESLYKNVLKNDLFNF